MHLVPEVITIILSSVIAVHKVIALSGKNCICKSDFKVSSISVFWTSSLQLKICFFKNMKHDFYLGNPSNLRLAEMANPNIQAR
jgi:hypothetical protein